MNLGNQGMRRVVAWSDRSNEGAVTTRWAANHATARRLPLHVMQFVQSSNADSGGEPYVSGLGGRDPATEAALALMYAVRRICLRRQDLEVTAQIVLDGSPRPGPDSLGPGDILVTGPSGYVDLAEHALAAHVSDSVGAPLVVVPRRCSTLVGAEPCIVLLAGARLSVQATVFAFEAASALRARLEVVRDAAQDTSLGADYWISPTVTSDCLQRRLRAMIEFGSTRYREVIWSVRTLRSGPWDAFRAMTRAARLTVLPGPAEPDEDVRRLLGLAAGPVVLVPTDSRGRDSVRAASEYSATR
jgi:hypothetical protein